MTRWLAVAALAIAPALAAAMPPTAAPENIVAVSIRKDVYFLQGRSDAVFVVGGDGVILVDTMTAGHADLIRQQIAAVTPLPIRYVINTHFHQDHTGSNEPFGLAGIPIVAQRNVLKRLSMPTRNMRGDVTPPAAAAALPTITYADRKTLSLAGVTAKLSYAPAGHTDGDSFVWLPRQNVMVTGDLLHTNEYPFLDVGYGGTLEGNLRSIAAMLKLTRDDTVFLPGHGGPFTRRQVTNYLKMMYAVRDAVDRQIKAGRGESEVVAQQLLKDDHAVPPGGPDNREVFIRQVYQNEISLLKP